jgi:hypothetical protein
MDPEQRHLLLEVESTWNDADVIIIDAPVGAGKSLVAMTLLHWQGVGSYIVPDNVLLQQILTDFPETPRRLNKELYRCTSGEISCQEQGKVMRCQRCPMAMDEIRDKSSRIGAYTYYGYYANKRYRDILIVDEAHKVTGFLMELHTKRLWKSKLRWPDVDPRGPEMLEWARTRAGDHPAVAALLRALEGKDDSIVQRVKDTLNGYPDEAIDVKPTVNLGQSLWPSDKVSKIVMMSATVANVDLAQFGLMGKRVKWVNGISNIPAVRRPIVFDNVTPVTWDNRKESVPLLAARITELAAAHKESGIVHLPYSMIPEIRPYLQGDRYIWHDKETRLEALNKLLDRPGSILMAAGMTEGISLNYDKARWQVITKMMYPSKADQFVQEMAKKWPQWYAWQAVKTFLQSYGRICRRPDDYGITYALDSLTYDAWVRYRNQLYPDWFNNGAIHVRDPGTNEYTALGISVPRT